MIDESGVLNRVQHAAGMINVVPKVFADLVRPLTNAMFTITDPTYTNVKISRLMMTVCRMLFPDTYANRYLIHDRDRYARIDRRQQRRGSWRCAGSTMSGCARSTTWCATRTMLPGRAELVSGQDKMGPCRFAALPISVVIAWASRGARGARLMLRSFYPCRAQHAGLDGATQTQACRCSLAHCAARRPAARGLLSPASPPRASGSQVVQPAVPGGASTPAAPDVGARPLAALHARRARQHQLRRQPASSGRTCLHTGR